MAGTDTLLVFDTGPLSIFAKQNLLGVLKAIVGDRCAVIPDVVVDELRVGAAHDFRLKAVLDAVWIEHRVLAGKREVEAFAKFAEFLVRRDRNWGETGVLALASAIGGIAVVDDAAARKAAQTHGVTCRPTLALMCDAIQQGLLTKQLVSTMVDDFLADLYRLPFKQGGFEVWAVENGFELP